MGQLGDHWSKVRSMRGVAVENKCILMKRAGTRLQVIAPYSDTFKAGAKELNGKWRQRSGCWSFPGVSRRFVEQLIREAFPEWSLMPLDEFKLELNRGGDNVIAGLGAP